MANNCLITKLKANVDNSNLEKLGEFKVKYDTSYEDSYIYFIYTDGSKIADNFYTEGDIVTSPRGTSGNVLNVSGTGSFYTRKKYSISTFGLNAGSFSMKSLLYSNPSSIIELVGTPETSSRIIANDLTGENIKTINPQSLRIEYISIPDISEFKSVSDLTNLTVLGSNNLKISMYEVGKCPLIDRITLNSNSFVVDSARLEDFILGCRSIGRDSGSLSYFSNLNNGLTYKGSPISGNISLSWAANSSNPSYTDVTVNGTTDTIDENGNVVS